MIAEYQAEVENMLTKLETEKVQNDAVNEEFIDVFKDTIKNMARIMARFNTTQDEAPLWISRARILFETKQWVPLEIAVESAQKKAKTGVALVVTSDKTKPVVLRPFDTDLKVEFSTPEELNEAIKRITEVEDKQIVVVINETAQDLPQTVIGQAEVISIYGQEINEKNINRRVEEALLRSV